MLLMSNVKEMGRRIVEGTSSKPRKGYRFWRDELSSFLVSVPECIIDIDPTHNDWTRKANTIGWIIVMANFSVELSSAVFDQLTSQQKPHYALMAMLMSFAGAFISALELVYKARKGKSSWFCYKSHRDNVRFGYFSEFVGLLCSLCQFIVLVINYSFVVRHANGPIKISVWPTVFAFFVVFSKVLDARDIVRPTEGMGSLHPKVV
ncbi:hypothetical protein ACFE04_010045 [Oxalis oulophora]